MSEQSEPEEDHFELPPLDEDIYDPFSIPYEQPEPVAMVSPSLFIPSNPSRRGS